MKLILIRHGEAGKNIGLVDSDERDNLTVKGVKQAVKLGEDLKDIQIGAIYCSHTGRCEQTLDEILRYRNDVMGIHFSKLLTPKIKAEPYEKLKRRMEMFIDDLRYDHEDEEIVVVISHLLPIEMITYILNGTKRRLENGEMVEVEVKIADET